ncbi:hypothetical protein EhVM1_000285 [Emiliania huxleyi virus M1]|nr:hypothetical protein EhVM1_000285 [Emiliania huxleyi virus M1]
MKLPQLKLGKLSRTHFIYGVLVIIVIFYILDYTEVFRISTYIGTATITPPPPEIQPKPVIIEPPAEKPPPMTKPAPPNLNYQIKLLN